MQLCVLESNQDMAFSEDNQDWIRLQIEEAIRPNGFKKVANWLRYWGLLGIAITAFLTLIGLVVTLGIFTTNKISQEAEFRGKTEKTLETIDKRLTSIEGSLVNIQLKQLSATGPQASKDAENILRLARSNNVKLDSEAITNAGTRFVEASNARPDAWATVQEFLSYRSYLNSVTVPLGPQVRVTDADARSHYLINKDNIPTVEQMSTVGASQAPDAAQLRNISGSDLNSASGIGPSLIVLKAPTVILDNLYAKKVVFENAHIIYRGGPVTLDDVYFLNCTFEIENHAKGQEMAKKILANAATSFLST